mmetsp:Transcript_28477/g.53417  ORF Transcript_28477/g.53417 Transcript_28477/m.53417 type:complete len:208 (-) Transcript_28477:58-681(-)
MEIASQMTKDIAMPDDAAGVGSLEEEVDLERRVANRWDKEKEAETWGIIEEPQSASSMEQISTHLNRELERTSHPAYEHPAYEIWLDALLTVLEDAHGLEKLQKLFLPVPMTEPKKAHEWSVFYQKKMKLERRLNSFFQWLQEEAMVKHYEYVREMAVSKERVLKQQSLVLTDYLQTLDAQIQTLAEETERLDKKNMSMRSHVSPLL